MVNVDVIDLTKESDDEAEELPVDSTIASYKGSDIYFSDSDDSVMDDTPSSLRLGILLRVVLHMVYCYVVIPLVLVVLNTLMMIQPCPYSHAKVDNAPHHCILLNQSLILLKNLFALTILFKLTSTVLLWWIVLNF